MPFADAMCIVHRAIVNISQWRHYVQGCSHRGNMGDTSPVRPTMSPVVNSVMFVSVSPSETYFSTICPVCSVIQPKSSSSSSIPFTVNEDRVPLQTLIRCSTLIGPISWGHSGPLCHALSFLSSMLLWTSTRTRRATVAA